MKKDTEIIRDFLLSLIQDPDSAGMTPSGTFNQAQSFDLDAEMTDAQLTNLLRESWDPLESELSAFIDLESDLRDLDPSVNPVTQLGDLSAVQNRFQALLKDRLRSEIERHPPLFPWEKSAQEYPDTVPGEPTNLWINPLTGLGLSAVLPNEIVSTLLERCQQLVDQSLKSGVQLVRAVESLFPDQPQLLQSVAQVVLQPAYRSSAIAQAQTIDYAEANARQQIALTMLAAKEILAALSLKVSGDRPVDQREWQTVSGPLELSLRLNADGQLAVQAELPAGGYLALESAAGLRVERRQPGALELILDAPEPGQSYSLVLGLTDETARPLRFTAGILDSSETP